MKILIQAIKNKSQKNKSSFIDKKYDEFGHVSFSNEKDKNYIFV